MKNLPPWLRDVWSMLQVKLPTLGIALSILIGGWIVAWLLQKLVYGALKRTQVDDKIAGALGIETGGELGHRVEHAISKLLYYIMLAMVLVTFFGYLGIDAVTRPFITVLDGFAGAVPNVLKAGLIGLVGFLVATGARRLITGIFEKTGIERRVAAFTGEADEVKPVKKSKKQKREDEQPQTLGANMGEVAYWFIIVVTAIPVLEALKIGALADPLSKMFSAVATYLPRILASIVLLVAGYLAARLVRKLVQSVLQRVGVDSAFKRVGFGELTREHSPSGIIATAAMVFVLLHFAISAVGRLGIDEVSVPLRTMLEQIYAYLPKLFVGGVLMAIGVLAARLAGNIAARLLAAMGFNTLMVHIGLFKQLSEEAKTQESEAKELVEQRRAGNAPADDEEDELLARNGTAGIHTPADIAGAVVAALVVLLFLRQTLGTMGMSGLATLLDGLLAYLPNVAVAAVVLGAGLWAGSWAHTRLDELTKTSRDRLLKAVGSIAHGAIVTSAVMIGLQQLGIGRQLIAIAFALILGAVCLALALAFGLGGREVASKVLQKEYDERTKKP